MKKPLGLWLVAVTAIGCSGTVEPMRAGPSPSAGSSGQASGTAGVGQSAGAGPVLTAGSTAPSAGRAGSELAGAGGRMPAGAGGAAGSSAAGSGGNAAAAGSGGSSAVMSATRPPELCSSPLAMLDVSHPTTVVGMGSPDTCTESALRSALAQAGVITFNCGDEPATIAITKTLDVSASKDTTIDGNDKIVLDGGGTTQILRAMGSDFRKSDTVLTVQRLVLTRGHDMGSGFKARDGDKTCSWGYKSGGGGAIFTRDVNVHAWGVTFVDNHGPELGPDVAGGAIYMTGSKHLLVASSTFRTNSAANGGAIGALQTGVELYNSVFEQNNASGMLANFSNDTGCPTFNGDAQGGAGGLGGAYYADGQGVDDTFCGVRMSNNTSGDLGGAVFRSAYWGLIDGSPKQTMSWDQTTLEGNKSAKGGGGGGYLNNAAFTLKRSTFTGNDAGPDDGGGLKLTGITIQADDVTFMNNTAKVGGAVALWGGGPDGVGSATNMHYSGNKSGDAAGDFPK